MLQFFLPLTYITQIKSMKELIDRLKSEAGLNDQQAAKSIDVIKNFIKEKFPMFAGAVDDLFDKYGDTDKGDYLH